MTETALVQKDCVPCRGGIPPLSAADVAGLLPQVPGWKARDDDTKIEARYRFKNFRAALDFVRDVGELAEAEFHHPVSITFGWGSVAVVLQTKKIKASSRTTSLWRPTLMTSRKGSWTKPGSKPIERQSIRRADMMRSARWRCCRAACLWPRA